MVEEARIPEHGTAMAREVLIPTILCIALIVAFVPRRKLDKPVDATVLAGH